MGTNYYAAHKKTDHKIHIGKKSHGWCFALHVYPSANLNSLGDWERYLQSGYFNIVDECKHYYGIDEFLDIVLDKNGPIRKPAQYPNYFNTSEQEFHRCNSSEPGPNNLVRAKIDGTSCIGHGPGPYSYFVGDFS